ncbi:hypothetical protein COB21_01390 [Candidatus Aerophobetes bacterium]|uniref:TRAM domain-containing protein n=1 Tax=Aerophobetes bacterium TaxID=2030807 RepID=A0A2A4X7P9_UNCAE|nr:MAG: hypothetical protein COB21_01390 [Candidatus Aerophobetes bacterium]
MNITLGFIRTFFSILCVFFMIFFMISGPEGASGANILLGLGVGLAIAAILIGFDILFRRHNLRSFNIVIIGLFIGYFMGEALVLVFNALLALTSINTSLSSHLVEGIRVSLFLFGTYLGAIMTMRASDELYVSIPFVKFASQGRKKKDVILDASALSDPRIVDLCNTGILDHQVIIPRFLAKELLAQAEASDDTIKTRAKSALDTLKKLETIDHLSLRFSEHDFVGVQDISNKIIRLARLNDANLITSDISSVQISNIDGMQIINLNALSSALKPLTKTGEIISVKVQRHGKEQGQGVGYLDDGTMVVINGGGDHIGHVIQTQVLSVKHTSSGRMIFCNTLDDNKDSDGGVFYSSDDDV